MRKSSLDVQPDLCRTWSETPNRLNMTEKLFTGTLNHNKNKKKRNPEDRFCRVVAQITLYITVLPDSFALCC